nr:VIT domain-containing protein [Polyangiaceae bacterium]
VPARGLGELKAKKPGDKTERSGAVTLTSHAVKVRVAGAMARTEGDETFTNNTDEVLEGIYRFPIPPDAKIERLALEVDGKLEEGAFVDRDRAASIWRGAIVNAAPKLRQQIRDEIVWVPGPWKDPALLEWQRGGRFELRIYPIPKRGARRVVLAYTQMLKPTGGVRRYSYPLPHDPSGSTKVDRFSVNVEVRGHDEAFGVKTSGYQLASSKSGGAEQLNMNASSFIPSGDLTLELALPGRDAELSAWAYQPEAKEPAKVAANAATKTADAEESGDADDGSAFVALALRPKLPRVRENTKRSFGIVVDASRSMYGESYRRAIAVAEKTVRELDRGDQFTLLACDTSCRTLSGGLQHPSAQSALEARRFLEGASPEGASDPTAAISAARSAAQLGGGDVRIVYIGDGTPTVGPIRQAYVTRAVEDAVPAGSGTVTTVAIGADSDLDTLSALARGGGGVVLPYVPGQTTAEVAFAVLGASYGTTLQDVSVELPAALTAVAPKRLDTIVAGGEQVVVARMNQKELDGTVVLRGRVGKESFEQRYPLRLLASSSKGNAFVPRLFAATRIADLERETGAEPKKEAIALSSRFDVASRFTSLLVLESKAMFQAFGLDNTRTSHQWTGEEAAEGAVAAGLDEIEDEEDPVGDLAPRGGGRARGPGLSAADKDVGGIGSGASSSGGFGLSKPAKKPSVAARPSPPPASAPAEEPLPFAQSEAKAKKESSKGNDRAFELERSSRRPWPRPDNRRMVPMRRIWERKGSIEASENAIPSTALPSAIAIAEREVEQAPNRRAAVQKLYSLLMLAGDVERAFSTA